MKKIISLLIVLVIIITSAVVLRKKPPVEKLPITPTPTVQSIKPQVLLRLTPTTSTAKIGQPLQLQLTLEPLTPQTIDGLDVIFQAEVKFANPTTILRLIRNVQQNNKTIISFIAPQQQTGFVLNQPLQLGEIIVTPSQSGAFNVVPAEALVVQHLTSQKVPLQLQGANLQITK